MVTTPRLGLLGHWWRLLQRWGRRWRAARGDPTAIPDGLWEHVRQALPWLPAMEPSEELRLRALCAAFLMRKQFSGAHGLRVNDHMALLVAIQACLPLRHRGLSALAWYDDFVGIVLHPADVIAPRRLRDEAGVIHEYDEELAGEAMQGGPILLSWPRVLGHTAHGGVTAPSGAEAVGHNLVIHEFAHAIDMHGKALGQAPDGCPLLPADMLRPDPTAARLRWRAVLHAALDEHRRRVALHERFGAPAPWLDAYGATSPAEFFAVACEAYSVDRARLAVEHPDLTAQLDAFFAHPQRSASQ
ncbi:Protein MtfA [Tepidimonas charontis]|uniref:Protein MtfA n=1 Tax=Tepidimonas charontis TaxID=2267262 RepID=A0A554XFC4_9BURK|nr:Protein MtfA [Tepidimonas charontis]